MIARVAGAFTRAMLVGLLIATPYLMMPGNVADAPQMVVLAALLAGLLTFIEYSSHFPSIVEFRDAPPFNRLRFLMLFTTIFLLSAVSRGTSEPSVLTGAMTSLGTIIGNAIDFPFSPVRLVVLMLPENASAALVASVRTAAGISYLVSLTAMVCFVFLIRVLGWPTRNRVFNVWVNLPLFDPTTGGDVLDRLQRDARINIALGFLLPFLIPAVVKAASFLVDPITLANPHTLIWTMTAWAFLPASMIMRGLALHRVADLIEEKRRRTYAEAEEDGLQPA
ncbi:hypothetical protein E4Z66_14230 [Aliishimia ponticola]|uniref:Uncharacterized protein n=2 Tax=Aliishimia ponticola TaxID=2499833 RepID=A0A4S4NA83_9RHOB|nr:hypothetical protein E4Z66_14230 [Aliishimia ponticola]